MARNISQVYDDLVYILRKERGGFVTINEAMNNLHMAQLDLFEKYWEEYLKTAVLPHPLESFKSRFSFSYSTSTGGLVARPSDYAHYLNGYSVTWNNSQNKSIRRPFIPLNESEIDDALNSQLRPITKTSPAIVQGNANFVLYPQEPQAGYIVYLTTPVKPVFAYTESGRTITYNPTGSVQLQWDDAHINEVILMAIVYISTNLNEQQTAQFAETKSQQLTP